MSGRVRRAMHGEGVAGDALLAAVLYAAGMLLLVLEPPEVRPKSWSLMLGWGVLGTLPIVLRRWHLWCAVAIIAVHTGISSVAPADLPSSAAGVVVLTYTAAAHLPLRRAVLATAVIWLLPLGIAIVAQWNEPPTWELAPGYYLFLNIMVALVCFFVGRTVWTRRAYVAVLEERARAAEASHRTLTQQAVAEERRRIARELHDVVAHHVSVMSVMATGARRALHVDPAAADEALGTIEQTGRTALREMRRLLNVLRTDDSEPAGELKPQPGVAGIASLVEQVREAGLPVTVSVDGALDRLGSGVALTVYRVVQEALTNALKHAGPASVEVSLAMEGCTLVVEVSDTGRGPTLQARPAGHGLLGMRERVALYGGTLRTGPRPGGGYRVSARIPLEPPEGADHRVRGAVT